MTVERLSFRRAVVIPSEARNLIIPLRVISPRNLISLYVRLIARVAKNRIENQNLSNAGIMKNCTDYPEIYTVEEFARIFRLSPEAVRSLIRKGNIPAIKIGKQYRIPQNIVDWYFAQAASPEELGFGMWKDRPVNTLEYINRARNADKRTSEEFLHETSVKDE